MKKEIEINHKKELAELNRIEQHLIELIAEYGDDILRDKFLEWQEQRNTCNIIYNDWLAETFKSFQTNK